MNLIDFLRILRKHMVLLILAPLMMASLTYYLTRKPVLVYSSETTLYTGIASGSSVDMDKSLSFFATNTAFDNLINVIKSRETQQEVAIRLLAQHLMLDRHDPKFISEKSLLALRKITPEQVRKLVVKKISDHDANPGRKVKQPVSGGSVGNVVSADSMANRTSGSTPASDSLAQDSLQPEDNFSFSSLDTTATGKSLPKSVDPDAYERTVENLKNFMAESDTNFVYKLLYFHHPHYSLNAISKMTVKRIGNSDLVKLNYDSDDPGICKQTLVLFTEVCIRNYRNIKENRSDAVVKYFEHQVKQSALRLRLGEDKLLKFNEDHNIINYYEQSKAVAIVKEELDVSYHDMRVKLAGTLASIKRIEEKLDNQDEIQLNNATIVEKRKQLSALNSRIAQIETISYSGNADTVNNVTLTRLKSAAEKLKEELKQAVRSLYNYSNSVEGLHINTLLNDWLKNVIQYEDTRAGLAVLGERITEFQKQYAIYAPAGATIKRIEREINVSEQEFLELLHGLNMAKLKVQDAELSASIKAVDPPFFPLMPNPTKRSLLIMVSAVFGFIVVLGLIISLEYFDATLKNPKKAAGELKLKPLGIFPKVYLKTGTLNFSFIANRLLEIIVQQIELISRAEGVGPRTLLFFSTLGLEGKSVITGNLARKMEEQGKHVLVLNYSKDSLNRMETDQPGYSEEVAQSSKVKELKKGNRASISNLMLGYSDTRVDYDSPFLTGHPDAADQKNHRFYQIDKKYFSANSYKDLIHDHDESSLSGFDYIFIEIPDLLTHPYPINLFKSASMSVLVCRANHVWSEADRNALSGVLEILKDEPKFLLNGVEFQVVETILGDLPKKRSYVRRILKKIIRFQFFTGNQP